jgi:hypothetical protein
MRKQHGERVRDRVRELVIRDRAPHVEEETSSRPQDPARLFVGLNLVRKEHRAELAGYRVKALICERQRKRVGLPPLDPAIAGLQRGCPIEHRLVEVGCDDARVGRKN